MQPNIRATIILGLFGLSFLRVLAYSVPTHAYLTGEIADFYSASFPDQKDPEKYRNYLIEGSRKEDDAPRWMNHFYDPVHDRGLTGFMGSWNASRSWAEDEDAQNDLRYKVPTAIASILTAIEERKVSALSTETDFAWQRAIRFYVRGEKEKAFLILGHILHLIEDTGVPDHTRNDPHPTGSPYEGWASQFTPDHGDAEMANRLKGKYPVTEGSIPKYFDGLAIYSNNNFYSKDTIGIQSGYDSPQPDYVSKEGDYFYGMRSDVDKKDYKLFLQQKKGFLRSETMLATDGDIVLSIAKKDGDLVLKDYWRLLSPKVVQYGAGVIDLFFKEAKKAENDPNFKKDEPPGLVGQIISAIHDVVVDVAGFFRADEAGISESDAPTPEPALQDVASTSTVKDVAVTSNVRAPFSPILPPPAKKSENPALRSEPPLPGAVLGEATAIVEDTSSPAAPTVQPSTSGGGAPVLVVTFDSPAAAPQEVSTGGDSTPPAAPPVPAAPPPPVAADHPVVSEVLFDTEGSDTGKEFVELYNPTDTAVDLSEWSLAYRLEDATSSVSLARIGSKSQDAVSLPVKGFFLVGLNNFDGENWRGVLPDAVRSAALPNGADGTRIIVTLIDASGTEVDSVGYQRDTIGSAGESIERSAVQDGVCLHAQEAGEFLGNACDRDTDADFSPRSSPFPQGSQNLPEPRVSPHVSGFNAVYSTSTLSLGISWDAAADASGATSTILYSLDDTSSSSIALLRATSTFSFAYRIMELDRVYRLSLTATDRDGLGESAVKDILIPGFVNAGYLYRNRQPSLGKEYVVDLRYDSTPFIPKIFLPGETWYQAMVFYLNREPNPLNTSLSGVNEQFSADGDGVLSVGEKGGPAAVFGLSPERCVSSGQGIGANCWYLDNEDPRVRIHVTAPPGVIFSPSDYFTIGYYDFAPGRSGNLRLVAYENTKRYFTEALPPELLPLAPGITSIQFNKFESSINTTWSTSTDPDTTDSDLAYESNISNSSVFDDSLWHDHGVAQGGVGTSASYVVSSAGTYRIGVRARDQAGNVSSPEVGEIVVPEPFIQYAKTPFLENGSQDFVVHEDGDLSEIQVFNADKDFRVPNPNGVECKLELYENTPEGQVLIVAADEVRRGWECGAYPVFTFPSHPYLSADKSYRWTFSLNAGEYAKVRFYGKSSNTAGGTFNNSSIVNSSFVVRGVGGILLDNE